MASLKGSILVTGSGGGLGSAIVSQILSRQEIATDYYGLYTVRKVSTAATVSKILEKATSVSHKHELVTLDLSSLASVRRAAEDINKRVANGSLPPIRALVLNAGYQEHIGQTFTNDGFDSSFQANYLSHFLLTLMLLEGMDKEKGRIVVLGSWAHDTSDPRNKLGPLAEAYVPEKYRQIFNDPMDVESVARGKWSSEEEYPGDINAGHRRYGAAKLCEMLMFRELSTRIAKDPKLSKISVVGIDPGAMSSGLARRSSWLVRVVIMGVIIPLASSIVQLFVANPDFRTTWKSGGDVLYAVFDTKTLGECPNGVYLNGNAISSVGAEAKNIKKAGQLWRESLGYAQVKEGDTVLAGWNQGV